MLYRLFEYVVCLLAAYGLLMLVLSAAGAIQNRIPGRRPRVRVVLLVKDAEEHIEYIIRSAVKKDIASKALSDRTIAVVDMDSMDHTYMLLEKLQKDFSNIEALTFAERNLIFEDFSIFSPSEK